MRKLTSILAFVFLSCAIGVAQEKGRKLGEDHLFMPKGAINVGMQASYFDIGGSNASLLLFLSDINASGSYFGLSPYLSYTYMDNRCIGLKIKYSNAQGGIAGIELELPGSDMELGAEDIKADAMSYMAEIFHRSYMGLDNKGRFGLFVDLALQYSNSKSSLGKGVQSGNYSLTQKVRAAVRPGLEVFVMNNVSSVFSIGIGGVSYSNSKNYSGGEVTGEKNASNARFAPDITDISMGVAVHF